MSHFVTPYIFNIEKYFWNISWLIFMIFSPPGPFSLHQNGLCAQSAVKFKFGSGTFLSLNGWVAIAEPTGNTENDCVSGVAQVRAPWWCSRDLRQILSLVEVEVEMRHDRVQGRLGPQASTTAPFWPETKHYVSLHHLHYSSHHISSIKKNTPHLSQFIQQTTSFKTQIGSKLLLIHC